MLAGLEGVDSAGGGGDGCDYEGLTSALNSRSDYHPQGGGRRQK